MLVALEGFAEPVCEASTVIDVVKVRELEVQVQDPFEPEAVLLVTVADTLVVWEFGGMPLVKGSEKVKSSIIVDEGTASVLVKDSSKGGSVVKIDGSRVMSGKEMLTRLVLGESGMV